MPHITSWSRNPGFLGPEWESDSGVLNFPTPAMESESEWSPTKITPHPCFLHHVNSTNSIIFLESFPHAYRHLRFDFCRLFLAPSINLFICYIPEYKKIKIGEFRLWRISTLLLIKTTQRAPNLA